MLVNYVYDSILLLLLLDSQQPACFNPGPIDLGPQVRLVVSPSHIKGSRYFRKSAFLVGNVEARPIRTLKLFHEHRALSLGAFIHRLVLRADVLLLFIDSGFLKLLQDGCGPALLDIGQVTCQRNRLVYESLLNQRFRAINLVTFSGIMVSGMLGSYRTLERFYRLFLSLGGLCPLAGLRNNHGLENVFVRSFARLFSLPEPCDVGYARLRQLVLPNFARAWLQVLSYLVLLLIHPRLLHAADVLFNPRIAFAGHSLILVDSSLPRVRLLLTRFVISLRSYRCADFVFHERPQICAILLRLKCPGIAS